MPALLGALLPAVVVVLGWDVPVVEDGLFWWVPKALLVAEHGPQLSPAGALPAVMEPGLAVTGMPPQWAAGLPDYAHPPLFYWLQGAAFALLGPDLAAVRAVALLLGATAGLGFVALAHRLGRAWAGLAVWALPPVVAQLLRPELDLGLLAVLPWALLALVSGRWGAFAALGALATWTKEPGVLLVVPAVVRAAQERRWRWQAAVPLAALGAWGLAHGGLAQAERLPASLGAWATEDLGPALWLGFFDQGRVLLLVGLAALARRGWRPTAAPLLVFVAVWVLFFSVVGFRLQPHNPLPLTHVRYFLPGLAVLAVVGSLRWPVLALGGLVFLHARSPYGPEASLHGAHAARAEAAAAPWLAEAVLAGERVWVGAYQGAALSQPWAGQLPAAPAVRLYHPTISQDNLMIDDLVIVAAEGEPPGAFLRGVELDGLRTWSVHEAEVTAWRVVAAAGGAAVPGPGPAR